MVRKLVDAAVAVAAGADDALDLLGPMPVDVSAFVALDRVRRTAARALIKAVEQQQDVIARLFRTLLIAEGYDVSGMTGRDIGNVMEKIGGLDDAYAWSDLAKLRIRLAHEYPVSASAQFERVREAAGSVPKLRTIIDDVAAFAGRKGYLG